MSNDMLSQDEIDALLRATTDENNNSADSDSIDDYLSPIEQDALGEVGNISFGSSATALSTLLNQKVEITTPNVTVIKKSNVSDEFPIPYLGIRVSYTEGFSGSNLLIIQQSDAAIIADLMLGGDGTNPSDLMGDIQLSAVQEAMNQMMGSAATSMSTVFNKRVDISPPTIDVLDVKHGQGTEQLPEDALLVKVSFRLKVGELIDSSIMQLLPLDFAKSLVNQLMNPAQNTEEQANHNENDMFADEAAQAINQTNGVGNQDVYSGSSAFPSAGGNTPGNSSYSSQVQQREQQVHGPQHFGSAFKGVEQPAIQPAIFSNFEPHQPQSVETKNLNMLLDIPLQVSVQLGSTKRSVKEILELSTGAIIELDKLAGEPVDILVNERLVAKGEVVVIDENFGVRVTDIISQRDRIINLR